MVKRIHVTYHLRVESDKREAATRAHEHHVEFCPMARTIGGCVAITTSLELQED